MTIRLRAASYWQQYTPKTSRIMTSESEKMYLAS